MLSPAARHRLNALAAKEAAKADNEYGGVRPDASIYQLQLNELKNDHHILRSIQSENERALAKSEVIPKHMPYVDGVITSDAKLESDDVVTTIMLWCFDIGSFKEGLRIADYALKHNLKMPDAFSRSTAAIVAEEIGNAARIQFKAGEIFDLQVLLKANTLTTSFDMHDEIRAKLYLAIGRAYMHLEKYASAVEFLALAVKRNENCGGKTELQKAEKLLKGQIEAHPATPLLNLNGSPVVNDFGSDALHSETSN
ncbi:phage terminase small subunit [Acinetobacter sp. ULE_I010]|uniref:phage terminase small subunit n=1 Tax=Acinetobacter sp. ULE_I010 TaxID=3373065 RepID=UPI003AF6C0D3